MTGPSAPLVLAEDDPEDRFLVRRALQRIRPGLRVIEVRDGIKLLEHLAARADDDLPRLVLLDLNRPRMNGREALAALRADARLKGLRVAALSTSIEPEDMRSVRALGVSVFLSKPDGFSALLRVLTALLDEHLDSKLEAGG